MTSEYFGSGSIAQLAAALDKAERQRMRWHLEQRKEQEAEVNLVERHIRRLSRSTLAIVHITLLASGFHRHKGQWRKVRYG